MFGLLHTIVTHTLSISNSNTHTTISCALRNTWIHGLTYAIAQCITYWVYAAVFRFGAFLVTQDQDSILYDDIHDVFRVFVAVILGGMAAGQVGAFAPNYAEAKQAANRIFALLDCKPNIDGLSEDGCKLVRYIYNWLHDVFWMCLSITNYVSNT